MKMSGLVILVLSALPLGGCQTNSARVQAAVVVCGTLAPLADRDMLRAADEVDAMPPGSVVAGRIVPDWLRMRDEIRACRRGVK